MCWSDCGVGGCLQLLRMVLACQADGSVAGAGPATVSDENATRSSEPACSGHRRIGATGSPRRHTSSRVATQATRQGDHVASIPGLTVRPLGRARGWASPARAASGVVASSTNESGDLVLLGEVAGLPIDRLELKQAAPMRAMGRLADRCWLTAAVTRGAGQGESSRVRHDGRSCACPAVRPRFAAARPVGASAPCRSPDRSGWLAGR